MYISHTDPHEVMSVVILFIRSEKRSVRVVPLGPFTSGSRMSRSVSIWISRTVDPKTEAVTAVSEILETMSKFLLSLNF